MPCVTTLQGVNLLIRSPPNLFSSTHTPVYALVLPKLPSQFAEFLNVRFLMDLSVLTPDDLRWNEGRYVVRHVFLGGHGRAIRSRGARAQDLVGVRNSFTFACTFQFTAYVPSAVHDRGTERPVRSHRGVSTRPSVHPYRPEHRGVRPRRSACCERHTGTGSSWGSVAHGYIPSSFVLRSE